MRKSCNGCRVLRKGCSKDCVLIPCLQWITSPESQANATVFLAKFYGRAGLMNLINAGPDHIRPEIFRSLLYEACGRIINPIYGSVGLMWSANWHHCQAAVDAVLKGSHIMQVSIDDDAAQAHPIMPLKGCDIRHLSKDSNGLHHVRTRNGRFKRSGGGLGKGKFDSGAELVTESKQFTICGWDCDERSKVNREPSHDSFSVETVENTLVNEAVKSKNGKQDESDEIVTARVHQTDCNEVVLELTLGLNPMVAADQSTIEELSGGDV